MDKIKFEDLKGSEKLKIEAAVLEIMESENFSLDKDLGIAQSAENPDNWIMAFGNKKCKFEKLANIRQILGQKFSVEITSKSKENFLFRIEAPSEEFLRLGQGLKPLRPAQPTTTQSQPSIGASQQQQGRPSYINSPSTPLNRN
ncbi:MAG: hypothetical protein IJ604_14895 [Prevotella sp.]|nr:hypothetical protein [Prevotella sp.]